ncbi:hypothetical protein J2741_000579 [Methanolinea mesophila]|uniref:HEAT repeat domain-containing protein n=1 Tax=Methanolinea mesophila TaxID=547055 RepID=UPI001AE3A858|nr:HEAT repeat domain-containing protein [Methanolinea mesophila]MBP1928032.1 hypothetical protein [Methanolinea mesophila]
MTPPVTLSFHPFRTTDVESLVKKQDVRGLIRLLSYPDFTLQWRAAEGLGTLGQKAVPRIMRLSRHPNPAVRLGMAEALAAIRDPAAVPVLEKMVLTDESEEVRWAAAITLGEIGEERSIATLVRAFRDHDKYVRYGAALALGKLGWKPSCPEESLEYAISGYEWERIPDIPDPPLDPLIRMMKDPDPVIRMRAFQSIVLLEKPVPPPAAATVLKDANPELRECAVRALPGYGFSPLRLPKGVAKRVKENKNPYVAAVLNFLFLGLGYNYLGRWWGFLLFQVDATAILLLSLAMESLVPLAISYTVSAVVAVHTFYSVKFMEMH